MESKFIIILPIIAITLGGYLFPITKNKEKPVFQPPDWVFGYIWTYISLALGYITYRFINSNSIQTKNKVKTLEFYFGILFCLIYWLYLNNNKLEKESFFLLVITCFISIIFLVFLAKISKKELKYLVWFLLPLPFWLVLASCLNGVTYNNQAEV